MKKSAKAPRYPPSKARRSTQQKAVVLAFILFGLEFWDINTCRPPKSIGNLIDFSSNCLKTPLKNPDQNLKIKILKPGLSSLRPFHWYRSRAYLIRGFRLGEDGVINAWGGGTLDSKDLSSTLCLFRYAAYYTVPLRISRDDYHVYQITNTLRPVVPDSHHFEEELDPDPHYNEKLDPYLDLR